MGNIGGTQELGRETVSNTLPEERFLVVSMGGETHDRNDKDMGTTVTVELPLEEDSGEQQS